MATVLMMDVVTEASIALNDPEMERWTIEELLGWTNDAQRAVVEKSPDAYTATKAHVCIEGSKQSIPVTDKALLSVVRNSVEGTGIRPIDRNVLDAQVRNWHKLPTTEDVEHFFRDPVDPRTFWLYPPAEEAHQVDITVATSPPDVAVVTGGETILIDDAFKNAMFEFVMARAFAKDAESSPTNAQRSANHMQAFDILTGGARGQPG